MLNATFPYNDLIIQIFLHYVNQHATTNQKITVKSDEIQKLIHIFFFFQYLLTNSIIVRVGV